MIKVEIDVNVRGLDFLKDFIGTGVGPGVSGDNGPIWTTNEVPKEDIPLPQTTRAATVRGFEAPEESMRVTLAPAASSR